MKWIMNGIVLLGLLLNGAFADGQIITTIAGIGIPGYSGDGGPATAAGIGAAGAITFDKNGNYYFLVTNRVRKVSVGGVIATIAGGITSGLTGDGGFATAALLNRPVGLTIDKYNNIYVSDQNNHKIRKITASTGIITTVAGTGTMGFSGDGGPATAAQLNNPYGISVDTSGNVYFADHWNYRIRKIDPSGMITTVAGTGTYGTSGDGGPATSAEIDHVYGMACDGKGNVYICDGAKVRKIDPITGIITNYAGGAGIVSAGDGGPATSASLVPNDLVFNRIGELYIGDLTNHNVRKVDTFGIITTVAGTGVSGYFGDGGPSTAAKLWSTRGVAIDACGHLYINDNGNYRIRKVTFPTPLLTAPTISITSIPTAAVGSPVTVSAAVADAGSSYIVQWMNRGIVFSTTTVPSVIYTKTAGIDTITARVVSTATYGCYDSTTSAPHFVTTQYVGVNSNPSAIAASIYPNPAGNGLTISAFGLSGICFTNLLGQVVLAVACGSDEMHMDIAGLPAGVYVVRVTDTNGAVAVRRVVKE